MKKVKLDIVDRVIIISFGMVLTLNQIGLIEINSNYIILIGILLISFGVTRE